MKIKLIVLFIIISIQISFSQKKASVDRNVVLIPLNTEVSIDVTLIKDEINEFKIVSQKEIIKPFDLLKLMSGTETKNTNDFYIRFGKSKFGDSENIVLIIRHKLPKAISYKAKVKLKNEGFVEIGTVSCYPNVASIEQWNYKIEEIQLYDFKYSEE